MAQFAESTYLRGADGGVAEVVDNCLVVNPKSEFQQAVEDGRAFSWASLNKDPDANDTMVGLGNSSTAHLLCIEQIIISMTVAGGSVCPVFTAGGITIAGTLAVPGLNLNRDSGFSAAGMASCITDETGQDELGSSWPKRLYMPQVLTSVPYIIEVGGAVRLPATHMIGVDILEAGTAANVTFIGWFEPL